MKVGWAAIAVGLLAGVATPAGAENLLVEEYACARQIIDRMPAQRVDCDAFDLPGPVYLWVRLRGDASALAQLAAGDDIVIRHKWVRYVGPNPQIETIEAQEDIPAGAIDAALIDKLRIEIDVRGYFDWRTWTTKDRIRKTRYAIEILDQAFSEIPCGGTGSPATSCGIQVVVRGGND